jgi:hypothetical protein
MNKTDVPRIEALTVKNYRALHALTLRDLAPLTVFTPLHHPLAPRQSLPRRLAPRATRPATSAAFSYRGQFAQRDPISAAKV